MTDTQAPPSECKYGTDTMSEMGIIPMCDEPQPKIQPASEPTSNKWWCPQCKVEVPPEHVTYIETHDSRCGGCGRGVLSTKPVNEPTEAQPEHQPTSEPRKPNPDEVICPACTHQFRAIPENVQKQLSRMQPTEAQIEEYEILCDNDLVAGANGPGARAEILHYLTQYEQDGPCEVYAVTRRLVDRAALAAKEPK